MSTIIVWWLHDHENSNSNSKSCICSAPPTISPMAHYIVSGRSVLSWTEMSLDDAWMLLSTTAWVSVLSATDSTHEVQRQRTHGLRIVAPSVEERGCRCWRRAATSVLVCRRPVWAGHAIEAPDDVRPLCEDDELRTIIVPVRTTNNQNNGATPSKVGFFYSATYSGNAATSRAVQS